MDRELSRRVPCTVRCWKSGNSTQLKKFDGLYVCPDCGTPWTLNQLDNWADTVEAVVAVMADHLDFTQGAREAFDRFLGRCIEGRREVWEMAMGSPTGDLDLATAVEIADSILQEGCEPFEAGSVVKGVLRTLRDAVLQDQGLGDIDDVGTKFAKALVLAEDIIDRQPELRGENRNEREAKMREAIQGLYSGSRLVIARLQQLQKGAEK